MREIIREVGPFTLRPKRHHFQTLASSIISQQISTSAAQTILHRLHDHLQPHGWEAQAIAGLDLETLRTLGDTVCSAERRRVLLEVFRGA
ncbi:MAG: hypothetical protein ACK53V_15095, partial [Planctomycetota bacterium]